MFGSFDPMWETITNRSWSAAYETLGPTTAQIVATPATANVAILLMLSSFAISADRTCSGTTTLQPTKHHFSAHVNNNCDVQSLAIYVAYVLIKDRRRRRCRRRCGLPIVAAWE